MLTEKIIEIRKSKGLTQSMLGGLINTSGDVIGKYERGEKTPSIDVVVKIANALETSVDYLTGKLSVNLDEDAIRRVEQITMLPPKEKNITYKVLDLLIEEYNN